MRSLLRADFFSLFKSKLTYIVFGICAGIPILVTLLYFGLAKATESLGGEDIVIELVHGRDLMFSTFSLSSNIGLVIPIFCGILLMQDLRNGTVRNKIVIGKSRTKIYFSHLIVSVAFCVVMSVVSFLMMTSGSLIFFKYGYTFDGAEAWNFAKALIVGILTFAYVATLATFIAMSTKSTGMTIVFTLILVVGLSLVCSLAIVVPEDSKYLYIFYSLPTYGAATISSNTLSVFGGGSELLSNKEFFFCLGSLLGFSVLNTGLGILLFNKTDLK